MFERLISDKIMITTFMDESWTWTFSDKWVVPKVSGINGIPAEYKATWYNIMEKVARYSPYTYGLSATKTDQLDGTIPATFGTMGYKIGIDLLEPKELAHRLAWMGEVTYFKEAGSLDPEVLTPEKAFAKMVDSLSTIEKEVKDIFDGEDDYDEFSKRTALIQCNPNYEEAKIASKYTVETAEKWVMNCNYECDDDDFIGSVLTSDNTYLFSKSGLKDTTVTEADIYKKLDDENDPLRFCCTIFMAKMGVTVRTWKEIFLFPSTEKRNANGYVVYVRIQSMGRGLTPNCGRTSKTFWKDYNGDFSLCPQFPITLNTINLYLWENKTNSTAVDVFKRDFCPTYEDYLATLDNDCPMCGAEPQHQKNTIHSVEVKDDEIEIFAQEKVNEQLDMVIN
jgi:hypothetical protein